jgi:hypothetical protein
MQAITPPEIPEIHVAFAKAVANLAAAHGIDRFEMTFRPKWEMRMGDDYDQRINGDMKIIFADVDGRGRPCRNLSINLDARLSLPIQSNPESSS